jgi:hypothetical protein
MITLVWNIIQKLIGTCNAPRWQSTIDISLLGMIDITHQPILPLSPHTWRYLEANFKSLTIQNHLICHELEANLHAFHLF